MGNTVETITKKYSNSKNRLMDILLDIQLQEGYISKDAVPKLLEYMISNDSRNINKAIETLNLYKIEKEKMIKIIEKVVIENKEIIKKRKLYSLNFLMGIIMQELRGKIDGNIVSKTVKERIKKIIEM